MKGVGRSLREESQRPLYLHCWDVALQLFRVNEWDWQRWKDAAAELSSLPLLILFLFLSPVVIPVAAYYRKRSAVLAVEKWERERDRVMN